MRQCKDGNVTTWQSADRLYQARARRSCLAVQLAISSVQARELAYSLLDAADKIERPPSEGTRLGNFPS
jgi:hypothetical protein